MSEPTTRVEEHLDALAKAATRIADALDRMTPRHFDVDLAALDEASIDWGILPPAVEPDELHRAFAAEFAARADEDDEPEPDPLDENDHRDRIDRDGDRWFWVSDHWHCSSAAFECSCVNRERDWSFGRVDLIWAYHGPLTFAPESDA